MNKLLVATLESKFRVFDAVTGLGFSAQRARDGAARPPPAGEPRSRFAATRAATARCNLQVRLPGQPYQAGRRRARHGRGGRRRLLNGAR